MESLRLEMNACRGILLELNRFEPTSRALLYSKSREDRTLM